MPIANCPICRSPGRARMHTKRAVLARCPRCGLVFLPEQPDREHIRALYGDEYRPPEGRIRGLAGRMFAFAGRRRARRLFRALRKGFSGELRCLDVGCGGGEFLEEMARLGVGCVGTELTEEAARGARARGLDVRVGDLTDLSLEEGSFHLATMWHVLEHTPRPLDELREVRRTLLPGGLLVLAVPNVSSIQSAVAGARWVHLDFPRHLWHFDPETLSRLVMGAGLEVARVRHLCLEQGAFGWLSVLAGLLGLSGLPREFLRGRLKGPARRMAFAASAAACLPAVLLALAEALLKRGGAVELWAVKR